MNDQEESYPIPSETMSGIALDHHMGDIRRVREICEDFGITTKNSRLERYGAFLERCLAGDRINSTSVFQLSSNAPFENWAECLQYVLREIHELMWILKGIKVNPPEGLKEKLGWIVSGRDFAFLDVDSRSRNAQFELRIASYFSQAGCCVDLTSETDIIVDSDDYVYYIECKRIGSPNKLRTRLSEARNQLRARMPKKARGKPAFGCVAADVTKVAFDHNGLTFGCVAEHSKNVIQRKLKEVCNRAEKFDLFGRERNLIVYWFQIHIAALVMFPQTFTSRFSSNHIYRFPMSWRQARASRGFWKIFSSVSVEDPRATVPKPLRRRTRVILPAGTKFYMNEELMKELANGGNIMPRDESLVVGGMEVDGIESEFTFCEFMDAIEVLDEDFMSQMADNPIGAQACILATMWGCRHPFEIADSDE